MVIIFWSVTVALAQKPNSVSGYVREDETGEAIVGAIVATESGEYVITNQYGFFMLPVLVSDSLLVINSLGYETYYCDIGSKREVSSALDIKLKSSVYNLPDVIVSGENINMQHAGRIDVLPFALKSAAILGGEHDFMKFVQQLPGIQAASEGKSSLSIRGGSPGENLILLDGVPVYNPEHVFGFISAFNSDAIKKISIYKSDFPARYGGRLSSIIDVSTKDGDKSNFHGNVSIGLLSAKMDAEGPIIKDKLSFCLSARRSYADLFLVPLEKKLDPESDGFSDMAFLDMNAKLHYQITSDSFASIQAYLGRDKCHNLQDEHSLDTKWGNAIISAKFNKKFGDKLFFNSALSYDSYHYKMFAVEEILDEEEKSRGVLSYNSSIRDFIVSSDFELFPSLRHNATFGGRACFHKFTPDAVEIKNDDIKSSRWASTIATEVNAYGEDEFDVCANLKLTMGLNLGAYVLKDASYYQLDPRFSFQYDLSEKLALSGGYSWMHQNNHLLSNNSLLLQTEMWVPVTSRVGPMKSEQVSMDIKYFDNRIIDVSMSMYYKKLKGIIDYLEGTSFSGTSSGWEDKVTTGIGRAYGVEFHVKKSFKQLTLTSSYTLSKAEQKFNQINFGAWYPSRYDRRHNIDVNLDWSINEHWSFFSHWFYSSGNKLTVPMMSFVPANIPDVIGYFPDMVQLDGRNNFRMPSQHRLDLGLMRATKSKKSRHGELSINIYNAYNRHNPYQIYLENELVIKEDGTKTYNQRLKQVSLFPIIPSVSYSYYW